VLVGVKRTYILEKICVRGVKRKIEPSRAVGNSFFGLVTAS